MVRIFDYMMGRLRQRLLAQEDAGVRVLRSRWPMSVETVDPSGGRVAIVAGGGAVFAELRLHRIEGKELWRLEQRTHLHPVFESPELSRREASAMYREMLQQVLTNAPGVASGAGSATFRWSALAVVLLAIVTFAPGSRTSPLAQTPSAGEVAAVAAASPNPPRDTAAPRVSATELTMLRTAAGRSGISLADDGKAFYVFSDPKCPYCQQLESTLEQLGTGHRPIILPVAYKPGAKEVAQSILCAKDARVATRRWRQALAKPEAPLKVAPNGDCSKGLEMLADNMTLFEMLKLTGTPAVVTASGRMFSGASGATAEQLRAALELP